jgi:hypothetical protein
MREANTCSAAMLACDRVDAYPHIREAPPLFHALRTFRKELVYSYYIAKPASA